MVWILALIPAITYANPENLRCEDIYRQSKIPSPAGFSLCNASGLAAANLQPLSKTDITSLPSGAFEYGLYEYVGDVELYGVISKFENEALGIVHLFTVIDGRAAPDPAATRLEVFTTQAEMQIDGEKLAETSALHPEINQYGWCAHATLRATKIEIMVADTEGEGPLLTDFKRVSIGRFTKCTDTLGH